ncbi:glycosyltransferase [Thermopirellula anaerolimosa]
MNTGKPEAVSQGTPMAGRLDSLPIHQVVHSLAVGGAEVLAARLAAGLLPQYSTRMLCLDESGPLEDRVASVGLHVHVLGRRPGLDRGCARLMRRLQRAERPAAVIAHQFTPFFYAAWARGLRRRPPLVFVEHGRFHPDRPSLARRIFHRIMLGRRDRVVAVGRSVREALIRNEGIPGRKIRVIYNGIAVERFRRNEDARRRIRAEWGLCESDFAVLQVARLDPLKDHRTAVRAAASLRTENLRWFFVGDGPERSTVEGEITRLDLQDRVHLLGERRDIPELLSAADAFVLTSISEGIPVTVLEAMAAGLPVAATRVGGLPELVREGETGLLVSPGDPRAVANAVKLLMADRRKAEDWGATGRRLAEDRFSESRMHAEYRRLLEEIISP